MAQKTKAAMRGRQCSTENKEHGQHTRLVAGGQRMSQRNFVPSDFIQFCTIGTAALAQLARPSQSPEISGDTISKPVGYVIRVGCTALQHTPYLSRCRGCEPVAHTLLLHTSFRVAQLQLGTSPQNWGNQGFGCGTYTKKAGNSKGFQFCTKSAKPCYPAVRHYFLSASFAFLRCRRLISPWTAALINWPVLSPGSLSCSIPSISSWAILAVTDCDFEFFGPVAISTLHCNWCKTIYTKFWGLKVLTCKTPLIYLVSYTLLCSGAETAKPGSGGTLTGPLTKPLIGVTVMADQQHTQTRPEFTWLFLATPDHTPKCTPVVLRFDADTEDKARAAFPGWDLVFAAKIRAQSPCRVAFFDYTTRRGWEFDSAAIQEVRHA
ncbi:host cell division inhibitor Icd-like protein [Escherichia coli]|nr:host cell division inhibitor Icd-like protein [Escherichia coli]EFB9811230.1 host cell division inhibitor Icd-like protein [Escherichia coli]EFC2005558.1 host cell division inhibitor Icd-like protein [Escherichia coli]EFC6603962.1 host cell division inhibitor Icd-like protein [Escherichia coli]EFI6284759.1 host cell division inhibitor Icd-like protein [Escherichia coli]